MDNPKTRRRYRPGEKHAARGRPALPPDEHIVYERQSASLPQEAYQNLQRWAERTNARARSGPHYKKASWRSWLHRFAMVEIPRLLSELDELGIETPKGWETIRLTVDCELRKEQEA